MWVAQPCAHSAPAAACQTATLGCLATFRSCSCLPAQQNHHPVDCPSSYAAHVVIVRLSWDAPPQQDQQVACMDACAKEYAAKVPKLQKDCQSGMKQLGA